MKRRLLCCVLSVLTVLCLCSCKNGEDRKKEEMPETLLLGVEIPQDYPETAATYSAEFFVMDEEKAVSAFGSGEGFTRTEYAEGPQYKWEADSGLTRYLHIYNGSEKYDTPVRGGLSYLVYSAEEGCLENSSYRDRLKYSLRKRYFWEADAERLINEELHECPQEELSFGTLSQVLQAAEEKMALCGFPEVQLYAADACSAELMNRNRPIYNAAAQETPGEEPFLTELSTDDEYYFVTYRQVVDEIPLSAMHWCDTDTVAFTEINLISGKSGLLELSARGLYTVGEPVSTAPVIAPEEALNVFLQQYNKAIHFETTEIVNFELNYVKIVDQDGMRLRPAWIMTTKTFQSETDLISAYNLYQNYVVSADSGVLLETEVDTR